MPEYTTRAAALLILLLVPSALRAQGQPNCQDPRTQTEMNICAGRDYRAADALLNRAYKAAIAQMKAMDADLPPQLKGAEKALRAAQRAWIPYREKACESFGFQARGGTMESMLVATCLANLTRNRTGELKDIAGALEGELTNSRHIVRFPPENRFTLFPRHFTGLADSWRRSAQSGFWFHR